MTRRSPRRLSIASLAILAGAALIVANTACVQAPPPPPSHVGVLADGRVQLPNEWILDPAGEPLALGEFPAIARVSPDGRWLAVAGCGAGENGVDLVDTATWKVVDRVKLDRAYLGLRFSADSATIFVSGGTSNRIHRIAIADGKLKTGAPLVFGPTARDSNVVGFDFAGTQVIAAMGFNHQVLSAPVDGSSKPATMRPGPAGELFPYDIVADAAHDVVYVSLQGTGEVVVLNAADLAQIARVAVGPHPNEMQLDSARNRLFVACANDSTVAIVDVTKPGSPVVTGRLNAALHPEIASGHTSSSLALAPDGSRLYVANSDAACVAVFDVSRAGSSRGLGFIPVGWYPTQVRLSNDGKSLFTICGKGFHSLPNPHGPQPGKKGREDWIGRLMEGGALKMAVPDDDALAALTVRAFRASPAQRLAASALASGADHPLVASPSAAITHCVYIIKENRTYDQVLGDMPEGNGDASLCLFPEAVTPNHHALARDFVLLDNFYVDAEVSADGHEWTMGAYATDFVEKTWPPQYSGRGLQYPAEGAFKTADGLNGHIWDRAAEAGVTYRSYGEFVDNAANVGDPGTAKLPVLEGHIDPLFRAFDLSVTDADRADRFLHELAGFEASGELPRFISIHLPNDHTAGTKKGVPTPRAMVADNDVALGRMVEGLSKSRFWPHMAIFILEDDAQGGPDHVDAHRSPAFVVSPYTRGRGHDPALYTTTSVVRTMGLALGLKPLSIHDAHARPMFAAFNTRADLRPWTVRPNATDLNEKGLASAWGADISEKLDLARADAVPDRLFSEIVWRSIRGAGSPMPAPVCAAVIRVKPAKARPDDDDDDDED